MFQDPRRQERVAVGDEDGEAAGGAPMRSQIPPGTFFSYVSQPSYNVSGTRFQTSRYGNTGGERAGHGR